MKIFDSEKLLKTAEKLHPQYVKAEPFPHIAIDNFMDEQLLDQALAVFPKPEALDFYRYNNPLEKKLAYDQVANLPDPIANILHAMNQPVFLRFLEVLTGIDGLIADPYYRGGGIHQIPKGGKLDVHIDFNKYNKLNLDRRLNALIYLNKDWKESYGGHFELWRGKKIDENHHEVTDCVEKVLPIFNRFVVFSTSEHSYHGHPEPISCPEGWTRKSLATYYYTAGRPAEEDAPAHSTIFIKRPADPEDADIADLRMKRNKGRLSSNVKSTFVADK
ncbi:MAG: proline hydroxylase [Legionellaceae bacterium]|nr:proline hydroxylase [Legionellaceae bacterium]